MLKLTGLKKINISIFISGTGSNLKNLIIHSFKKNSKFKITLIITNNPKAKGLNFAKKFISAATTIHNFLVLWERETAAFERHTSTYKMCDVSCDFEFSSFKKKFKSNPKSHSLIHPLKSHTKRH